MSITSANAVVMIGVAGIFPIPFQLQGFAADDIFDVEAIEAAETMMGVDGILTGGMVFVPIRQTISLMADSPSNLLFDTWWAQTQQQRDIFPANGNVVLRGSGQKWTLTNGILTNYKPLPDAKKVLQPRRFQITWQQVIPAVA
jgi:hypothetical protein